MCKRRLTDAARPLVVSIVSGKGGVGKSVLTANLGYLMARQGIDTLLVDADPYGSLHHLTNSSDRSGDLIAITDHLGLCSDSSMINDISEFAMQNYPCVFIDHAAGLSDALVAAAKQSAIVVLVTVPELTAIAGSYQLYKELITQHISTCGLLVNRAESVVEGQEIHERFTLLCRQFLASAPKPLGTVLEDPLVSQSVQRQAVLAGTHPETTMIMSLAEVVAGLVARLSLGDRAMAAPCAMIESPASADTREYCPYGH